MKIYEIMQRNIHSVSPSSSIKETINLMKKIPDIAK